MGHACPERSRGNRMSLVEINWQPDARQLRSFGIISLIASAVISFVLHFLMRTSARLSLVMFAAGLVIFLLSLFSLRLTRMIYQGLMIITLPISFAVSFLLLAALYFLLLTPLGLVFRLIKRDPLNRKFDTDAQSYWQTWRRPDSHERYFRQF